MHLENFRSTTPSNGSEDQLCMKIRSNTLHTQHGMEQISRPAHHNKRSRNVNICKQVQRHQINSKHSLGVEKLAGVASNVGGSSGSTTFASSRTFFDIDIDPDLRWAWPRFINFALCLDNEGDCEGQSVTIGQVQKCFAWNFVFKIMLSIHHCMRSQIMISEFLFSIHRIILILTCQSQLRYSYLFKLTPFDFNKKPTLKDQIGLMLNIT